MRRGPSSTSISTQRVDLRSMLGATLVKQAHHQAMFAELFDRHFPAAPPAESVAGAEDRSADGP